PNDVNQAEYAEYTWEYYPESHANEFLLRYEFDALGNRKEFLYNANQLLVEIKEPDDTGTGYHTAQTFTYDAVGRLKTSSDAVGRTSECFYDERNRVVKPLYDDSSTELYFYGTGGDANLLVKQKDRNGTTTACEYDDAGRRVKTITAYSTMNVD